MLPPPPVLAPPLGTAVAAALDDTSGVGAVGVGVGAAALAELVTGAGLEGGAGLDAGGLTGGGLDGGGVDLHVQVGDGVGVVGVGVGVGVWQWHPPDGAGDEL